MNIDSPFVEFAGNHFENFHSSMLSSIHLSRMMNNTILNTDAQNIFQLFDHKDFHDNYFQCSCQEDLLNVTKHSSNYEILKNNYCITKCNLSVFEFEVESVAKCMKDGTVDANSFCTYERSLRKLVADTTPLGSTERTLPHVLLQPRFLLDDSSDAPMHSGSRKNVFSFVILIVFSFVVRI
ncbi:hypothetical protein RI129_006243 [Pyrocoelia pectoralis]|uniref:Uncharacterized protein n=1 Tax=Pyrocoelia pectoralis TaxID=417401 RepID=A0AAN7VGM4_9COLE